MRDEDDSMVYKRGYASANVGDAIDEAALAYDRALMGYEDALITGDPADRVHATAQLDETQQRLATARAQVVSTAAPRILTFDDLLSDPTQQLDVSGSVMASVLAYQSAPAAAASATPRPLAPVLFESFARLAPSVAYQSFAYVQSRLQASTAAETVAATASAA